MKYIFLNLKRFDIPASMGGVNHTPDMRRWAAEIMGIQTGTAAHRDAVFAAFFPEAHILGAVDARTEGGRMEIGCQSVHHGDVAAGGNFGAFTTGRTAKAAAALGCTWTIIGHCEERRDILYIMEQGTGADRRAVSAYLNQKMRSAIDAGLRVLYCVGETAEEQPHKYDVLKEQLSLGLEGADLSRVIVAYEPVWAIGPGKVPPDAGYIRDIAAYIKGVVDVPVVYGGGLKKDNAGMLASIGEIDGGLIALTRFSGDIGFYPEEYLEIVDTYMDGKDGRDADRN